MNGNFSDWGEWGWWSATCGPVSRTRLRHCNNPSPASGGAPCTGPSQDVESSTVKDCEGITYFSKDYYIRYNNKTINNK